MLTDENGVRLKTPSKLDTVTPPQVMIEEEKTQDADDPFLVGWDGDKDHLDPRAFSGVRKWFYVAVVAVGSLLV